jgi:hypothetical protein
LDLPRRRWAAYRLDLFGRTVSIAAAPALPKGVTPSQSQNLNRFPGHAENGPISAAATGTGNSSVFRHAVPRPKNLYVLAECALKPRERIKRPEIRGRNRTIYGPDPSQPERRVSATVWTSERGINRARAARPNTAAGNYSVGRGCTIYPLSRSADRSADREDLCTHHDGVAERIAAGLI